MFSFVPHGNARAAKFLQPRIFSAPRRQLVLFVPAWPEGPSCLPNVGLTRHLSFNATRQGLAVIMSRCFPGIKAFAGQTQFVAGLDRVKCARPNRARYRRFHRHVQAAARATGGLVAITWLSVMMPSADTELVAGRGSSSNRQS